MPKDKRNKMPLTARQARFCEEYIRDNNATQAMIRAGYSAKSAHNNVTQTMSNKDVIKKITELRAELTKSCKVDAEEIVNRFDRIAQTCEKERPSDAIRANELIGKHLGIFERDNSQRQPQFILNLGRKK